MKASKILVATKKQLHSYVEFLGFSLKVMRAVSVFFLIMYTKSTLELHYMLHFPQIV